MTTLPRTSWASALALAALYALLARASLFFIFPPENISAFWLPNGAALAWILLRPRAERPLLLGACAAAVAAANLALGRPATAAAALALVNVVHVGLGLWMCDRWGSGPLRMNRTRDAAFLVIGPAAAAGAAAGLLRTFLVSPLLGAAPSFQAFLHWWSSNLLGTILTAPPVLCWTPKFSARLFPSGRRAEGALALAATLLSVFFAFHRPPGDDARTYLVIPPLLWTVLRFGPRGASAALLPFAAAASFLTGKGWGPFAALGETTGDHLFALHGFLIVTVLCANALAAVVQEREDARRDAAESRLKLDSMLQRVPAVMWTVDRELRFTFSRGAGLETLGLKPDQLKGTNLQTFFGTEDPEFPSLKAHREALAGRSGDYQQAWDGRVWQTHVDPFHGPGGEVIGVIGVAQDVTREMEMEETAHRAHKMEALSRLASHVAHDFNNSLTAILGYCDLLMEELQGDDPRRRDLLSLERAAQRAAATAQRLTSFSRHKLNEARPLDLNALLQETDRELGEILGPAVSRVYRLEAGLPLTRLDPAQVKEVLRQLAANAKDAMPQGGQFILATSRRQGAGVDGKSAPDGRHVRLTVQDTGTGLPEEAKAHLFEPYFTTKPSAKDRGLGLATCYGLVRQNDGVISLHSAPGKGTAFHLDFPLWEGVLPLSSETGAAAQTGGPPPRGYEVILLAEDEDAVRDAVSRGLEALGYTVLAAADGRAALDLLEKKPEGARVRLLLSDVMMPVMNGVELARELARRRPEVRRLLMSGYAENSLLQEGTLPPGTAFLQKPFVFPALARRVRETLDAPAPTDLLK